MPLEVVVGAEVDVVWTRTASDEELRLATYGQAGTDMLLETPYGPLPPGFEDWVFSRLSLEGIRVMLAHPERNLSFQQSPERLAEMVSRGVLVQVTAGSLAGKRKSESRKLARWMVEEGLAQVIASDAHRADRVPAPVALGRCGGSLLGRRGPRPLDGHRRTAGGAGRSAAAAHAGGAAQGTPGRAAWAAERGAQSSPRRA